MRTDGLKLILDDGSWVCFRLSGTEPVVRAYTEARDEKDMVALRSAAEKFVQVCEMIGTTCAADSDGRITPRGRMHNPICSVKTRKPPKSRFHCASAPSTGSQQGWRPAGTVFAVMLALAFAWSVVNGRHGLSTWYQQRTQEKQLKQEIEDLQQENAHLRNHVDRLKSDPDAIEHEAREKLHYAKPGEVIYTLPPDPQNEPPPIGK